MVDIAKLTTELEQLDTELSQPDSFKDPKIADKTRRQGELRQIIELSAKKESLQKAIEQNKELSNEGGELAELAKEELPELESELAEVTENLRSALTPKDPNDHKNVIIEIRAGAGGDESSLFAGELFRMYSKVAESKSYKIELINENPSDVGGFKEIIFKVKGEEVYRNLKFESGVHRVQRVPATETQGRIHTSTVTVAVLPEAEETDIQINNGDLKIDTYRASGNGGQSVNTTDSAVRITHLPSGVVVTCQDEKSQIKNKAKAMSILRSRILQKQIEDQQTAESAARLKLIGSGDRSEKIRTYNFPQDRITDHRIGYSRSGLPAAMDGSIDDLIEELLKAEAELVQNS